MICNRALTIHQVMLGHHPDGFITHTHTHSLSCGSGTRAEARTKATGVGTDTWRRTGALHTHTCTCGLRACHCIDEVVAMPPSFLRVLSLCSVHVPPQQHPRQYSGRPSNHTCMCVCATHLFFSMCPYQPQLPLYVLLPLCHCHRTKSVCVCV
jgi:hypothetical protein